MIVNIKPQIGPSSKLRRIFVLGMKFFSWLVTWYACKGGPCNILLLLLKVIKMLLLKSEWGMRKKMWYAYGALGSKRGKNEDKWWDGKAVSDTSYPLSPQNGQFLHLHTCFSILWQTSTSLALVPNNHFT